MYVRDRAVVQSGQPDAVVLRRENGKIIGRFPGLRANRVVQKVRYSSEAPSSPKEVIGEIAKLGRALIASPPTSLSPSIG
jgi:hypothetical protein